MTNLEIIKYLAYENPKRLAELLDDIYCIAWNCGSYASSNGEGKLLEECEIDDFNEWLHEDPSKCGMYYDHELESGIRPFILPSQSTLVEANLSVRTENFRYREMITTPLSLLINS